MNEVLFKSGSCEWSTPQWFFDELNEEFGFTLDPCATELNHKCENYYTKNENGLEQDWAGNVVFCNPPYGREIGEWVRKCHEEAKKPDTMCVMLIPARTDIKYFHEYIYNQAEVRFIRGRLKFGDGNGRAPFPSMIVVFGEKGAQK